MTSQIKIYKHVITALSTLFFLFSCNSKNDYTNTLSVTIEPQRYFLEQIVGDKYKVHSLIGAGANPESFDPSPLQMLAVGKSKAYFKIGYLGVEKTLVDKIKDQSALQIFDCSSGVTILDSEDHHHENNASHHYAHAGGDPHYWSSINSAKHILKNMLDGIVKIDKENESFYTQNYNLELHKINKTDSIIQSLLHSSASNAFIIYHPALSYFADEYNLKQLSIEHEGKNPSPTQLKHLIDRAQEKYIHVVFIQQEFDKKNAETIAHQIGAKAYVINLLSYNWHDEMVKIAKAIADENK